MREIRAELKFEESMLAALRESVTVRTAKLSDMPKSKAVNSEVERIALRIVDAEKKVEELKIVFNEAMARLEKKIKDAVKKSVSRVILILRYVDCMKFEDIGAVIGYSEKHTRRLHKKALGMIVESCPPMYANVRCVSAV